MENGQLSRRVFLKSMGIMLLLSGCTPDVLSLVSAPTATPLPSPTPTPLPRADSVAQAFLQAWSAGDYASMYNLMSPGARQRINFDLFQSRYQQAQNTATVSNIETQLQSLLQDGPRAAATFHLRWETRRFGDIIADNQMQLVFEAGRWGVDWQPTLILPQLGEDVILSFLSEQPTRGNIYDKNFHALATQGEIVTVGLVPQFIQNEPEVVATVSELTGVPPEKIRESIAAARPDWFVPIADISFDASLQNDTLLSGLAGVDRRARTVRTYTDGDIAAHVIGYMGKMPPELKDQYVAQGYTGDEMIGLSGVEAWSELDLAGKRGGRLVALSPGRQVLSELATTTSKAGSSVYLTFDTEFQARIEGLLGPRKGAIVVMNPASGAIYALATFPRFRPADITSGLDSSAWSKLYSDENRPLLSRATQGTYPPGSIFKIISLTAALELLGYDPNRMFTCTGRWQGLGPAFTKTCWLERGHGQISLLDGLTQSCNVVFYEVGLALHRSNPDLLPDWARKFGLGDVTRIFGLAEESRGVIPDNAWTQANFGQPLYDGDAVNSAIGQGYVLVTPMQIARILAAVANGGKLVRPRVIDKLVPVEGPETAIEPEFEGSLPILPETMALLKQSLNAITSGAHGTARKAFEGATYTVAGKTGTAESGFEKPHAWFAGYAPADEPRVAITVMVEQAGEGSQVAAPLFRQVLEAFFEWEAGQT